MLSCISFLPGIDEYSSPRSPLDDVIEQHLLMSNSFHLHIHSPNDAPLKVPVYLCPSHITLVSF